MLGLASSWDVYTASTTFEHPLSDNHIFANLNGLVMLEISKPSGIIHNGQWFEALDERW